MKVTDVRCFTVDCFRTNWVFVKVYTDEGLTGVGEATLEYKEKALIGAVEHIKEYLVGKNPLNIEKHFHDIYRDAYWRGGALELKKIADIADENGVAVAVHMAESPIACLAAVHTAAAMHNCLALEFHSVDVPWWADIVKGIPNPLFQNGFIKVPEKPGLGFDDINEEVIKEHINPNIPGYFESTDEWNTEFSNDRIWS